VVAGLERDLGVERKTAERGAQLVGQGERPRLSPVAEGPESRLAALRQHAAALDRRGVELGEERLVGLVLGRLHLAAQPGGSREMAQDALVGAEVLATLDREVPSGATLYMLDVTYYRDARQGVYERAGLIRADIATRYVSSRGFEPAEADCYV
jgi:hypothetical protein